MTTEKTFSLMDLTADMLPRLQVELDCESQSATIDLLILSQVYDPATARALLAKRAKRGRRWPVRIELPDEYGVG